MRNTFAMKSLFSTTFKWSILIFFVFITLFPLTWLVLSSLKTNIEFQTKPFAFPVVWQWRNYWNAITLTGLPLFFINSIIVALLAATLNLFVSSLAAYMLSRIRFKAQHIILNLISVCILVPIIALMIPYYRIISNVGLYDTLWGLILVYSAINLPISLYLMRSYMLSIPFEVEEAAVIDGCTIWQRFYHLILPLSRPGLATVGVFVFLYSWNEFIYALLLTSSERARTIQLGIRFFRSQFLTDYTTMFAAITITIIPTVVVYIFSHQKIINGLTAGAVKQ